MAADRVAGGIELRRPAQRVDCDRVAFDPVRMPGQDGVSDADQLRLNRNIRADHPALMTSAAAGSA